MMSQHSIFARRFSLALACLVLAATPPRLSAGAWSQEKGSLYLKFSGISYSSDEIYNDMGDRQPMGEENESFAGSQGFLYAEYGLGDRLTAIAQANAGVLVSENRLVHKQTTGIGDVDIGARYQLTDGPVVLSPLLTFKIPTGYHADYDPPFGTGKIDAEVRFLAARSLYPLPLYIGLEGGYRVRGGEYSNQVPWFAEAGVTPNPRLFMKAYVEGKDTRVSGDTEDLGVVGASVQVSEGDFTKAGLNVAWNVQGPFWVDVLAERTIAGENIGAGTSLGIGLSCSY